MLLYSQPTTFNHALFCADRYLIALLSIDFFGGTSILRISISVFIRLCTSFFAREKDFLFHFWCSQKFSTIRQLASHWYTIQFTIFNGSIWLLFYVSISLMNWTFSYPHCFLSMALKKVQSSMDSFVFYFMSQFRSRIGLFAHTHCFLSMALKKVQSCIFLISLL